LSSLSLNLYIATTDRKLQARLAIVDKVQDAADTPNAASVVTRTKN